MRPGLLLCVLLLGSVAGCAPASAKIFFRVAPSPLPPAAKIGIQDMVLVWPVADRAIIPQLRSQGYQVWLQCESKDASAAVAAAEHTAVTGLIIVSAANWSPSETAEIRSHTAAQKNLAFRLLIPGGKQPQMKGRLVVERDGILQVSSPSTQPWLDTNLAMVRLAQSTYPDLLQMVYDFRWSTSEVPPGAWYPDAEDYALAIAESDAVRSDVIIDLPARLQKALSAGDPQAWSLWKIVMPYLDFSSRAPMANAQPITNFGVIFDDAQASYEAINLMARHNLAFEAVRPSGLTPARLSSWNSLVVFCSLSAKDLAILHDFAAKGGIVIFVNSHNKFPWHSTLPVRRESHATTYKIGAGEVVELGEPVIDPENFARDLRRLIGRERSTLSLWNSLTTLVTAYRGQDRRAISLYLVNYADQPDNVQLQVKGRFKQVRFESPDEPCCVSLPFVERNGFTEFTIASLRIAARVHLDFRAENSATN